MILVLRVPGKAYMAQDEEWAKQYHKVQQVRSERAQGTKIIKIRDTMVSFQPLNAVQNVFGFQLHHTDHLL